jgi:hypothetical protein
MEWKSLTMEYGSSSNVIQKPEYRTIVVEGVIFYIILYNNVVVNFLTNESNRNILARSSFF